MPQKLSLRKAHAKNNKSPVAQKTLNVIQKSYEASLHKEVSGLDIYSAQ